MTKTKQKAAIFLDRDGVIIENQANYVLSWDDVEIFEQAMETLARYSDQNYLFIIVTNQSPVGRGLISFDHAMSINARLIEIIESRGGRIDGAYICPHAPQENCNCRKPKPGMLLKAAKEFDIDLSRSVMIGDALTDLKAGIEAGVSKTILLKTGRGVDQMSLMQKGEFENSEIYKDLSYAFSRIFGEA